MAENNITTQVVARWAYVSLATAREFAEVHGHPMDIAVIMRTIADRDMLRNQFEENWEYPKVARFHFVAPGDVLPMELRIGKVATMGKFNPGASWMLCLIARCVRGAGIRTWTDLTAWEPTEKETKAILEARMEEAVADLPDAPSKVASGPPPSEADGEYGGLSTSDQVSRDVEAEVIAGAGERETFPHIAIQREPDAGPVAVDEPMDGRPFTEAELEAQAKAVTLPETIDLGGGAMAQRVHPSVPATIELDDADVLPANEIPDADPPSPSAEFDEATE